MKISTIGLRRFVLLLAIVLAGTLASAGDGLRIVPIVHEDQMLVSFELPDAYGHDVRDLIFSGLRTSVTYDIALRIHAPVWVDRTVATAVVTISDEYNNLTRRHHLSRVVDGRVDDEISTEDETVVKQWLTTTSRLPICRTNKLDPNRDYYVRVSARVRPTNSSLLGWAAATVGQAKFTFIP
jgi:hypothetical protein